PWHWRAALWRFRLALRQRTSWVPVAPLAAVMVLALVVGMARLAFTGTVRFGPGAGGVTAGAVVGKTGDEPALASGAGAAGTGAGGTGAPARQKAASTPVARVRGAVLVVAGFGSSCCHSANALRAAEPHLAVRQFSYRGLTAAGQPVPYHRAGNLSLQVLGDRL